MVFHGGGRFVSIFHEESLFFMRGTFPPLRAIPGIAGLAAFTCNHTAA
jgi:hypothetical protein